MNECSIRVGYIDGRYLHQEAWQKGNKHSDDGRSGQVLQDGQEGRLRMVATCDGHRKSSVFQSTILFGMALMPFFRELPSRCNTNGFLPLNRQAQFTARAIPLGSPKTMYVIYTPKVGPSPRNSRTLSGIKSKRIIPISMILASRKSSPKY